MEGLQDPQVLLSRSARESLKNALVGQDGSGQEIFDKTVEAIRDSLEASVRTVFIISAFLMLLAFLIICTIPPGSRNPGAAAKQ